MKRQLVINFNKSNLCSGELLGHKFIVPCNPEEYLSFQYGKDKWKKPMKEKYFNFEAIFFFKYWTDEEWPYVVRWYNLFNGTFDPAKSLAETNQYAKVPYESLPQGTL